MYLREYPCKPAKWRGIKVKLTPKKIRKKKKNIKRDPKVNPKKTGHQRTTPVKIPKTAPKLKTMWK